MAMSNNIKSGIILVGIFFGSLVGTLVIGQASGLALGETEQTQVFSFYEWRGGIRTATVGISGETPTMTYTFGNSSSFYLANPYSAAERAPFAVDGTETGQIASFAQLLPDVEIWYTFPYASDANGTWIPTDRPQYVYQLMKNVTISDKPMVLVERKAFITIAIAARTISTVTPAAEDPVSVANTLGRINSVKTGLITIDDNLYNDGTIGEFSYNNNKVAPSGAPAMVTFNVDLALIDTSSRGEVIPSAVAGQNSSFVFKDSWMGIYGAKITSNRAGFVTQSLSSALNGEVGKLPDDETNPIEALSSPSENAENVDNSDEGRGRDEDDEVDASIGNTLVFSSDVEAEHGLKIYQQPVVTGQTRNQALPLTNRESVYLAPDSIRYNKTLPTTLNTEKTAWAAVGVSSYAILRPRTNVYITDLTWDTYDVTKTERYALFQSPTTTYSVGTALETSATYCSGAFMEDVFYYQTITFDARSAKLYEVNASLNENIPLNNGTGYNPYKFTKENPNGFHDPVGDTSADLYQAPPIPAITYIITIIAIIAIVIVVYFVIKAVNKGGKQAMAARTGGVVGNTVSK